MLQELDYNQHVANYTSDGATLVNLYVVCQYPFQILKKCLSRVPRGQVCQNSIKTYFDQSVGKKSYR